MIGDKYAANKEYKETMKATILYYSHKGRTAGYAREMAMFLWSKGISVSLCALSDFDKSKLSDSDYMLLGCWTCGLFILGQHPHQAWKEKSKELAGFIHPERLLLFTTYKIRTGSMFSNMKRALDIPPSTKTATLKSKTGRLTDEDKMILSNFIGVKH